MNGMEFDWKWLLAAAVAAVLGRVWQMGKEVDALKVQLKSLRELQNAEFPSETTEEMAAIRDAKALCKKIGDKFTFNQAYKAVRKVREQRAAKETTSGDGRKTA